jgi:hypothetical protein
MTIDKFWMLKRLALKIWAGLALLVIPFHVSAQHQVQAPGFEKCKTHLASEGPWSCTPQILNTIKCSGQKLTGPDPAFQEAKSHAEAVAVVQAKFSELQNAANFVSWLKCQNFRSVEASLQNPDSFPGCECDRPFVIIAQFSRLDVDPYPLRWFHWWAWGGGEIHEAFSIVLDDFGQARNICISRTM